MMVSRAHVQLRWLTAAEGGRSQPFVGSRYTPTAHLAGENEFFSIVLDFATIQPNPTEGRLSLLFPELQDIQSRIVPGCQLEITEGSRKVALCRVLSLEMEKRETTKV